MSAASLLRVAAAGSVDDGKSTLIGRLLVDTKQVFEDQLESVRSRDGNGVNLAHLTDGLRAERERGITIDVAYRYFATPSRRFILADTPGHEEFTRNMVTGASRADVMIVLVDATQGVVSQSRRHLAIGAVLRVPHVLACVNKMDAVGYDEGPFSAIAAELAALAERLGVPDLQAVPISALEGDNVVETSGRMPWYEGPSLLRVLETLPPAADAEGSARLPVQWAIDDPAGGSAAAGQLARGTLRVGDEVVAAPSGGRDRIASISVLGESLAEAAAPRSVSVRLESGSCPPRGTVIAAADDPPPVADDLVATACSLVDEPLESGARLIARSASGDAWARVSVLAALELESFAVRDARELCANDIGRLRLRLDRPLALDRYADCRYTGSLILIDPRTNATVAGAMVKRPA
jgi:sulfate adenylyltransferase subunit 1